MASTRKKGRGAPRKGALKRQRPAQAPKRSQRRPLEDYSLGEVIGPGLAGTVHAARYLPSGKVVAVEEVRSDLRRAPAFVSALGEAGRAAAEVTEPHVLGLYDVIRSGRRLYVVSELPRGTAIGDTAVADQARPLEVIAQVLAGLEAIHAAGLAHGRVEAGTVLLDETGAVRLGGLGVGAALCAVEGRDCSRSADLVGAATLGLQLLQRQPKHRRSDTERRARRALRQVAGHGAGGTLDSAAALRRTIEPGATAEPKRTYLGLRRAALVACSIVLGVGIGVTVTAARNAQSAPVPLSVTSQPRLSVQPQSGSCGTTFVFTGIAGLRGSGTLAYQWSRSDGTVGQVTHVPVAPDVSTLRVTNEWTLVSPGTGTITMTLRVLSPQHFSVSQSVSASCK